MPAKERAAHFGRMVYDKFPAVLGVQKVMDTVSLAYGTSLTGKVTLVHGGNGVGKSVACEHYLRKFAKDNGGSYSGTETRFGDEASIRDAVWVGKTSGNSEVRPMIKVDIAPRVTANGLLGDTFLGLTGALPPRGARHTELLRTINVQLRSFGTEVLVFDNAHHAVERRITDGKSDAGDIFAAIADKTGVEILLIGTDHARSLFTNSEPLRRARRGEFLVPAIERPTNGSEVFFELLTKYQNRMPFDRPSDLTSDEVVTRLYTYCDGNIETLSTFLSSVVLIAIMEGYDFVDLNVLEWAYDSLHNRPPKNPFRRAETIEVQP